MLRFLFQKLVRDKVVQATDQGEQWQYKRLEGRALKEALVAKLHEEAAEIPIADATSPAVVSELADVQEVVDNLRNVYEISQEQVAEVQAEKRQKKGSFTAGYFVEAVSIPEDSTWVEYFRKDPSYKEVGAAPSIACSYAFTGEDEAVVRQRMQKIRDVLIEHSPRVYCNLFDPDVEAYTTAKEFIDEAIKKMATYDAVLVIMTSDKRSEGMLLEIGAALARGQRVMVAQHVSAVDKTYVPSLAHESFQWATEEELLAGIRKIVE